MQRNLPHEKDVIPQVTFGQIRTCNGLVCIVKDFNEICDLSF